MSDSKVNLLINKFADETKSNLMAWKRLAHMLDNNDMNQMVEHYIYEMGEEEGIVKKQESYYTFYKGGLIFLICVDDYNDRYILSVQKEEKSKVRNQNSTNEYQSELRRLKYLIEDQLDDSDDFIDDILKS